MSSLLLAIRNGHRSLEDRVKTVIAEVGQSGLCDPSLNSLLDQLQAAIKSGEKLINVEVVQFLRAFEHVSKYVCDKDKHILKLEADISALSLELSIANFRQVYGDYSSHCVRAIISEYESDDNVRWSWEQFHRKLMEERENKENQYLKTNNDNTVYDEEFITELYQLKHHKLLLGCAAKLNWSARECDLLFLFNDQRNAASHGGLRQARSLSEKKALIKEHKIVLEKGVPEGFDVFEDVLKKAVLVYEASVTN